MGITVGVFANHSLPFASAWKSPFLCVLVLVLCCVGVLVSNAVLLVGRMNRLVVDNLFDFGFI